MKNIVLDLETLGFRSTSAILSIGAVILDTETLDVGEKFYVMVTQRSCWEAGLTVDMSTITWWALQSDMAKTVLRSTSDEGDNGEATSLSNALLQLTQFMAEHADPKAEVWGNGSDFDNAILANAYSAVRVDVPWKFWNNRCMRTLKSVVPKEVWSIVERKGLHHNALDDAIHQANIIAMCLSYLAGVQNTAHALASAIVKATQAQADGA